MKVIRLALDLNHYQDYAPKKPFYVIMPAYNENHSYFVAAINEILTKQGLERLLVVDDGSDDGTAEQVLAFAKTNNLIKLISYKPRLGKEGAIKKGLTALIQKNFNPESWIVLMDSDGQHKPKDIPRLLYAAELLEADLVSGYRSLDQMPLTRKAANYGMRLLLKYEWKFPLKDCQCGFKVIRGKWVPLLSSKLREEGGYKIELSLIYHLIKAGATLFCEVPIQTEYKNYSRKSGMGLTNTNWLKQFAYTLKLGAELQKINWLEWLT